METSMAFGFRELMSEHVPREEMAGESLLEVADRQFLGCGGGLIRRVRTRTDLVPARGALLEDLDGPMLHHMPERLVEERAIVRRDRVDALVPRRVEKSTPHHLAGLVQQIHEKRIARAHGLVLQIP